MRIHFFVSLGLLALLACYGCGGSSEVEMKQAREAMEQAKDSHAEKFAPTDLEKAQTAWDHAQAAEKEGRTDNAKVLFTSAKIFFGKAASISKAKQDALSRELDSMQLMIGKNFDQVKTDFANKNLSSAQKGQVESIISEVEKMNASIEKMAAQHELAQAVSAAKEVQTKIYHAQLILAGQKIK